MNLIQELEFRGFIEQYTAPNLPDLLLKKPHTYYIGFDPSADSFHVGQLSLFNLMGILKDAGHPTIALMGGATGMIGDPSGRSKERNLLTPKDLQHNISKLQIQFEKFLSSDTGELRFSNNNDWWSGIGFMDVLREIGKHMPVATMVSRDSVAKRLSGEGITYTEFSYMVLQAYDFLVLYKNEGCTLQLGGSDQWGNIVSGIDLIRRLTGGQAYGFTVPLVTKSDGTKFGKSMDGAVWLDPGKTSDFDFYQFFLRQSDSDVINLLKRLTRISIQEIIDLEQSLQSNPEDRQPQKRLAFELTKIVHGAESAKSVSKGASVIYGKNSDPTTLSSDEMKQAFQGSAEITVHSDQLKEGVALIDTFVSLGLSQTKSEARRLIKEGGGYVNNERITELEKLLDDRDRLENGLILLRAGKKKYGLVMITD